MTLLAQFAATGGGAANYIEDVFSTYLYTGNGSTQTITNEIDLAGEGGLVWIKDRNSGAKGHALFDTARGVNKKLQSQSTNGEFSSPDQLTAFNADGFALGSAGDPNGSGTTYASWTFRKQPKFFDVVTYTGDGANRTIAHSLGSVPGCIIVKRTDATADWQVYHRSNANTQYMVLNTTAAVATGATRWNSTTPTDTVFSLGTDTTVNASGGAYVAYLFAHDAGGFGLTGTDNVISCGSFTTDGSGNSPNINIGYEPQWLLVKCATANDTVGWGMFDTMRGWTVQSSTRLLANTSAAETSGGLNAVIKTDGFQISTPVTSETYIYIAIRRGPMKVPTTGTSVFSPNVTASQPSTLTSPPASDLVITRIRESDNPTWNSGFIDRLRGDNINLVSSSTGAEVNQGSGIASFTSSQAFVGGISASSMVWYLLKRAPGYFDEVCYTGTGSATTVAHNLAAVPELMIMKPRSTSGNWPTYTAATGNTQLMLLNTTDAAFTNANYWNSTTPTSSVFTLGINSNVNGSGTTYVAYLFATCPGVSKVGSYTGTGTTLQINCGFTAGSRFVMIKRTDSTGDWYVWDSARGIVAGNDPYLLLNSTAAEVTSTDYVDTFASGFELTATAPAAINASGGTYIFLAIA
jgi:hypothetical protein